MPYLRRNTAAVRQNVTKIGMALHLKR